jgi:hypothetical protein
MNHPCAVEARVQQKGIAALNQDDAPLPNCGASQSDEKTEISV